MSIIKNFIDGVYKLVSEPPKEENNEQSRVIIDEPHRSLVAVSEEGPAYSSLDENYFQFKNPVEQLVEEKSPNTVPEEKSPNTVTVIKGFEVPEEKSPNTVTVTEGPEEKSPNTVTVTEVPEEKKEPPTKTVVEQRKEWNVRGQSGLKNMGNTCYMNSMLQCLSNSKYFCAWLRSKKYEDGLNDQLVQKINDKKLTPSPNDLEIFKKFINLTDKEKSEFTPIQQSDYNSLCEVIYADKITYQLAKVLKQMWDINCVFAPRTLKKLFGTINQQFAGHDQNDSQELLNLILDRVHEETKCKVNLEFNNVSDGVKQLSYIQKHIDKLPEGDKKTILIEEFNTYKKTHHEDFITFKAYEYWMNYTKNSMSVITNLFTGLYKTSIVCSECNNETVRFEPFTSLTIPIEDGINTTLDECVKKFVKEEEMIKDNQYRCTPCNKKVDAIKYISIWDAPKVLIIHLIRFKNTWTNGQCYQTKINTHIDFPINSLDISNCLPKNRNKKNYKYDLCSISKHSGSNHGGHYTADCKNATNGFWYHFDDTKVTHLEKDKLKAELVDKSAYVLFYERTT